MMAVLGSGALALGAVSTAFAQAPAKKPNILFIVFEQRFLRRDVEGALLRGLLDPLRWFSSHGRTEMAVAYYQESLFGDATFADLTHKDAPLILINTSDLSSGARFTFVQDYFNLLCSDLTTFSLARAVTASSAVPVVLPAPLTIAV